MGLPLPVRWRRLFRLADVGRPERCSSSESYSRGELLQWIHRNTGLVYTDSAAEYLVLLEALGAIGNAPGDRYRFLLQPPYGLDILLELVGHEVEQGRVLDRGVLDELVKIAAQEAVGHAARAPWKLLDGEFVRRFLAMEASPWNRRIRALHLVAAWYSDLIDWSSTMPDSQLKVPVDRGFLLTTLRIFGAPRGHGVDGALIRLAIAAGLLKKSGQNLVVCFDQAGWAAARLLGAWDLRPRHKKVEELERAALQALPSIPIPPFPPINTWATTPELYRLGRDLFNGVRIATHAAIQAELD